MKDGFQDVKDCTMHTQLQSIQIWMFSYSSWINPSDTGNVPFSLSCGLSARVSQIINVMAEKCDIFIFTSQHMGIKRKSLPPLPPPPEKVLTSIFAWLQINLNSPFCIFVPNFMLSSLLEQIGQNLAVNLWTIIIFHCCC